MCFWSADEPPDGPRRRRRGARRESGRRWSRSPPSLSSGGCSAAPPAVLWSPVRTLRAERFADGLEFGPTAFALLVGRLESHCWGGSSRNDGYPLFVLAKSHARWQLSAVATRNSRDRCRSGRSPDPNRLGRTRRVPSPALLVLPPPPPSLSLLRRFPPRADIFASAPAPPTPLEARPGGCSRWRRSLRSRSRGARSSGTRRRSPSTTSCAVPARRSTRWGGVTNHRGVRTKAATGSSPGGAAAPPPATAETAPPHPHHPHQPHHTHRHHHPPSTTLQPDTPFEREMLPVDQDELETSGE